MIVTAGDIRISIDVIIHIIVVGYRMKISVDWL